MKYTGVSVSVQVPLPRSPLHDSLNAQILSVQYGYWDPLLYGYRDSLGIGITYSTCMVTEAPTIVRIPRLYGYRGGLDICTTDIETPV